MIFINGFLLLMLGLYSPEASGLENKPPSVSAKPSGSIENSFDKQILDAKIQEVKQLMDKGQAKKASLVLEEILKANPNHRQARLILGRAYLAQKKYQHALNAFSFILLNNRNDAQACWGRALALVGLADVPKAIIWAKKATEFAPDDLDAWDVLGSVYMADNYLDAPRAEAAYRQILVLDPKNRKAKLMLAKALSYEKKVDDAILLLEQLVKQRPGDTEAGMKLAESYYAVRKLSKANAVLNRILEYDHSNVRAKALLDAIDSRRAYQFWIPIGVGIALPLLYFFIRRMRRGRIVQE